MVPIELLEYLDMMFVADQSHHFWDGEPVL